MSSPLSLCRCRLLLFNVHFIHHHCIPVITNTTTFHVTSFLRCLHFHIPLFFLFFSLLSTTSLIHIYRIQIAFCRFPEIFQSLPPLALFLITFPSITVSLDLINLFSISRHPQDTIFPLRSSSTSPSFHTQETYQRSPKSYHPISPSPAFRPICLGTCSLL